MSVRSPLGPWIATIALLCLLPAVAVAASPRPGYTYISPYPGTLYHQRLTNIIIRPERAVDRSSLSDAATIQVTGDFSGAHPGRVRLSDDGRTIVFRPSEPFIGGERVACRVAGIRTVDGESVPEASFDFTTAGIVQKSASIVSRDGIERPEFDAPLPPIAPADTAVGLTGTVTGMPAPGRLFLADFDINDLGQPSNLLIARDDGAIVRSQAVPAVAFNYSVQPDGRRTYFDNVAEAYYALDDTGAVVDSFRCGNGYETDGHDLILLPNGHALLMAYDEERMDVSAVVPGGSKFATVTGLVVQELDLERDVVFQWRSWESIAVDEARGVGLTAPSIDYVHGNSLEPTPDDGILISCRHLDAVLKVSRETGEVLWRLGGARNDFTFVGDPDPFSHQHDVRLLPDGHITLFDNGNGHTPQASRAVEYAIDEDARTATLVWEYRHDPGVYAFALGSVQRLPNGNTLIGWGATSPAATEVSPDGQVVSELLLPPGLVSYRVRRFEWPPALPVALTPLPASINPGFQGRWASFILEPDAFDVALIDPATARLQGTIPADPATVSIGDNNGDNRTDIRLRFDMSALVATLHTGENRVDVEGPLTGGGYYRGYAIVTLIDPRKRVQATAGAAVDAASPTAPTATNGAVSLGIFDVQGRLVRHWTAPAGGGGRWDGRADDGRRLASGVYFVRELAPAPGGRRAPARKIVLAR